MMRFYIHNLHHTLFIINSKQKINNNFRSEIFGFDNLYCQAIRSSKLLLQFFPHIEKGRNQEKIR